MTDNNSTQRVYLSASSLSRQFKSHIALEKNLPTALGKKGASTSAEFGWGRVGSNLAVGELGIHVLGTELSW